MQSKRVHRFVLSVLTLVLAACSGGGGSDDGGGGGPDLDTEACSIIGSTPRSSEGVNLRIVNGTRCSEANSPVVKVLLVPTVGLASLCSGSLITPTHVLTAAHCFLQAERSGPVSVLVEVNGTRLTGSRQIHPQAQILGNSAPIFDVAVVQLNASLNVPTLPILVSVPVRTDDVVSIFGYGKDENGELEVLRSGETLVDDVDEQHITSIFRGAGSNSCEGDSGGPALLTITKDGVQQSGIVGLVSSGSEQSCGVGDVSVYAHVSDSSMLNFIQSAAPGVNLL